MSQPSRRIGPPTLGGQAAHGGSQPCAAGRFRQLQRHARGVAEWIDADQTGTGTALAQGHDHRGNVWGRPLGSGNTLQFYRLAKSGLSVTAHGALFVPDCSPLGGQVMRDPATNGGYQAPEIWIYADSAPPTSINVQLTIELAGSQEPPLRAGLLFSHPGAGKAWVQAAERLVLPPGLVIISAQADLGAASSIEQLALVVPH